jgi:hypothetical protein
MIQSGLHNLDFEREFWGNCTNTLAEEYKHFVYAPFMGLNADTNVFSINVTASDPLSILDMGGGPASMLLKTHPLRRGVVWDPIAFPDWVRLRYADRNIELVTKNGEDLDQHGFDEVWIYNCLQHTIDPETIVKKCMRAAKVIRIFEWINIEPYLGHPHKLTAAELNAWTSARNGLSKRGTVQSFNGENGCFGEAYCLFAFTGS